MVRMALVLNVDYVLVLSFCQTLARVYKIFFIIDAIMADSSTSMMFVSAAPCLSLIDRLMLNSLRLFLFEIRWSFSV